jgi:hypothetical protein
MIIEQKYFCEPQLIIVVCLNIIYTGAYLCYVTVRHFFSNPYLL